MIHSFPAAWLTWLALTAAVPAPDAGEENPAATLVAGVWSDSGGAPWHSPTHPTVRSTTRLQGATAAGLMAGGARQSAGGTVYAGRAEGRLLLPLRSGLTAELRGGLLALDRDAAFDRRTTRTAARLRLGDADRNGWLGVAFEHGLSGERLPEGAMLGLGAASRVNEIALAFSLEQTAERVRIASEVLGEAPAETLSAPVITVYDSRFSTATSALLSGRWERGRLAIETVAGLTLNRLARHYRWSQSSASLALLPRLSAFGTVGNAAPRWLALDAGFERRATLGLRLTSWANSAAGDKEEPAQLPRWRLRHLGRDWYVIEIRAADARQVTVMGDFTEWQTLPLRHVTGERWALAVQVSPGVHQVQVRLDAGPWLPPAGLATTADGFNGSAGVFVAE